MRVSMSQLYDHAISSFATQQSRIYESQKEISTGIKHYSPHEDPIAAVNIDRLENIDRRLDSYNNNIGTLTERFAQEDVAMNDMAGVYQRVRELTVQAGNASLPLESRVAIAAEMRENLLSLAELSNSVNSQGHYTFAGAEGERPAVQAFVADGMVGATLFGDDTARELAIAEGRKMEFGATVASNFLQVASEDALRTRPELTNSGSARAVSAFVHDPDVATGDNFSVVFDTTNTYDIVADDGTVLVADQDYQPGKYIEYAGVRTAIDGAPAVGDAFRVESTTKKDAFTVVNQIIGALRSGSDEDLSATVDRTLDDINALQQNLSIARVEVGAKMNSIEAQENTNADMGVRIKQSLSSIRDTDYVTAIAELQQEMNVFQAAQSAFAKIQQSSLFDHI